MKNKIGFAFILTFLTVLTSFQVLAECQKNISIHYQLKAFKEKQEVSLNQELSSYQFPDYKEDDILRLWKLEVINDANCIYPSSSLKIILQSPQETIDHLFCEPWLDIPELKPYETYSLKFTNFSWKEIDKTLLLKTNYVDSKGNVFSFCGVDLLTTGLWQTSVEIEEKEPTRGSSSMGYGSIDDNSNIRGNDFKVRSKTELESIEQARESAKAAKRGNWIAGIMALVSIVVALIGIRYEVKLAKSTEKTLKQVGDQQINELKNVSKSIQDSAKKQLEESKKFEIKEKEEKEKSILNTFKLEMNENKYQLEEMLGAYENYKEGDDSIKHFRTLSVILCERVLKDVNPERTGCHLVIERLRSSLTFINNFNRDVIERPRMYARDLTQVKGVVRQALKLMIIIHKKLK